MKSAARIIALGLVVLPLLAAAQMRQDEKITVNVPFEFVVDGKTVPAGEWAVRSASDGAWLVSLSNREVKVGVFTTTTIYETQKPASRYALVFHKYGDEHYLAGIKVGGSTIWYHLPQSKAEAELRAKNVPAGEEVVLARLN